MFKYHQARINVLAQLVCFNPTNGTKIIAFEIFILTIRSIR
jgi:hypothetical protein